MMTIQNIPTQLAQKLDYFISRSILQSLVTEGVLSSQEAESISALNAKTIGGMEKIYSGKLSH